MDCFASLAMTVRTAIIPGSGFARPGMTKSNKAVEERVDTL